MFMEAVDSRRLSLMLLSVVTCSLSQALQFNPDLWRNGQTPTKVQKLVQLLLAERHVSVAAEADAGELKDV